MKEFEPEIETITLQPSEGGVFELTINGELVYSKRATERHMEAGEGVKLVRKFLQEGKG
ncbi:MAG: Rdx family protein [Anaerolineaceae bacterium]|nr:Rdx family protein [Anaerolineaceae bacterium]